LTNHIISHNSHKIQHLPKKIVFVNGESKPKPLREKIETASIETEYLISEIDLNKLEIKLGERNEILVAKKLYDKVTNNEIIPEQQTE